MAFWHKQVLHWVANQTSYLLKATFNIENDLLNYCFHFQCLLHPTPPLNNIYIYMIIIVIIIIFILGLGLQVFRKFEVGSSKLFKTLNSSSYSLLCLLASTRGRREACKAADGGPESKLQEV